MRAFAFSSGYFSRFPLPLFPASFWCSCSCTLPVAQIPPTPLVLCFSCGNMSFGRLIRGYTVSKKGKINMFNQIPAGSFDQSSDIDSQHRNKSSLSRTYVDASATGNFFLSIHWRQNLSHWDFELLPQLPEGMRRRNDGTTWCKE